MPLTSAASRRAGALPLVLAAVLLAACSTYAVNGARLGTGTVEAVWLAAPAVRLETSASGGASAPRPAPYRVLIHMDDGTTQTMAQNSGDFQVGDRVRVVGSGQVIRPPVN